MAIVTLLSMMITSMKLSKCRKFTIRWHSRRNLEEKKKKRIRVRLALNKLTFSSCVCPVINHEFRHNTLAVDPQTPLAMF